MPERSRAIIHSLGWALILPAASAVLTRIAPVYFANTRHVYYVYELAFVALTQVVALRVRRDVQAAEVRRFLLMLGLFEVTHYALWALSDLIILSGLDMGFALRLVPDAIYYTAFVPFVMVFAPRAVRN